MSDEPKNIHVELPEVVAKFFTAAVIANGGKSITLPSPQVDGMIAVQLDEKDGFLTLAVTKVTHSPLAPAAECDGGCV